jgi:hypothetical protein
MIIDLNQIYEETGETTEETNIHLGKIQLK